MSFDHPAFQSGVLPLGLAFVLAGLLRLAGGSATGPYLAGTAMPAALLTSVIATLGMPSWPPAGAPAKWPYVVAVGLALGCVLDSLRVRLPLARTLELVVLIAALAWLAWPWLHSGALSEFVAPALFALVCMPIVWRIADQQDRGVEQAVMVMVAALGLAGVAIVSASLSIAQLGVAVAAAVAGFALWSWPIARFPFGAAGVSGVMIPLFCLAMIVLLATDAPGWALAPLGLVFFVDRVSWRLPAGAGRLRQGIQAVYVLLLAALPAAAAVIVAILSQAGADAGPYYR